ncbi:hypothetical protein AX769_00880 [Frondihabitans sp. PAMC 28766]|nr:hypothetical protein AX769_00880 [Frondihabitans sp. PAMC 28766]
MVRDMHSNWFLIPFGVVFAAIGAMNVVNPRMAFRMNRWQYKNKEAFEPSNAALVMARVTGCIAIAVGIGLLVFGIVSVTS